LLRGPGIARPRTDGGRQAGAAGDSDPLHGKIPKFRAAISRIMKFGAFRR